MESSHLRYFIAAAEEDLGVTTSPERTDGWNSRYIDEFMMALR
jgi:hypothetical protein